MQCPPEPHHAPGDSPPCGDGQRVPGRIFEERHPFFGTRVVERAVFVLVDHMRLGRKGNALRTEFCTRGIDVVHPEVQDRRDGVRVRLEEDAGAVEVEEHEPGRIVRRQMAGAQNVE